MMWTVVGWFAFALALAVEFVWRWPHLVYPPAIAQ
jgi:hypothetical protein